MLCIPAGIFTFLKFFGDNRFDVEVYHSSGVDRQGCISVSGQYHVADSVVMNQNAKNVMVFFIDKNEVNTISNTLNRLIDVYQDKVNYRLFAANNLASIQEQDVTRFEDFDNIKNCIFLIDEGASIVLLDKENRIRGYYTLDLDDIDRLILESKILLENDAREK